MDGNTSNPTLAGLMTPLKAIRARCLNCRGFEKTEVRECDFTDCHLHTLGMGRGARATLRGTAGSDAFSMEGGAKS